MTDPFFERVRRACPAYSVAEMLYPGYPDLTTASGWAEIPAAILAVDLTSREDIEYTAMLREQVLLVADASLRIAPVDDGRWLWVLSVDFEEDRIPPLDVAGVAEPDSVRVCAQAELFGLTTDERRSIRRCSPTAMR